MTRVVTLFLLVAGVAGAAIFVSEPDWYLRARYPLRYEHIVRGHSSKRLPGPFIHLARRLQIMRYLKGLDRCSRVLAHAAINLAGRKAGAVEQHLQR